MTCGIRVPSSLENRKNPKAGATLHYARCDQDVLVVVKVNLVFPRNSMSIGQRKVGHLSVYFYVYRSMVEGHPTHGQHSLIKLWPECAEMPEARPGDFTFEHHSLVRVILSLHTRCLYTLRMIAVRTSRALLSALRSVAKDKAAKAETRLEACKYLLMLEGFALPLHTTAFANNDRLRALLAKR